MNPIAIVLVAVLIAGAAGYVKGRGDQKELEQQAIAAAIQEQANATVQVVTKYVDKIRYVNRSVPVVRDRLVERVCDGEGLSAPGSPAEAHAGPETDAGTDLSREVVQAVDAVDQCQSLIDWFQAVK